MPRITFEVGLAIGSIILTVVLLVLDKAGKLKGAALYGLLALALLMTIPLAVGNPLVANAAQQWKLWLRTLAVAIVFLTFWAIAIWISPSQTPPQALRKQADTDNIDANKSAGIIEPDGVVLFAVNDISLHPTVEIGDSGTKFVFAGKEGSPLFVFSEESNLTIERVNGRVVVSTAIRNRSGQLIAELIRNEWKIRPSLLWDRNFNSNALEVRDEAGNVVLQVESLPDRIRLQAVWSSQSGSFAFVKKTKGGGAFLIGPNYDPLTCLKINPIFVYPSDLHPGELISTGHSS